MEGLWSESPSLDPRDAVASVDFQIQLPEEFLHIEDRFSMAHSLEALTDVRIGLYKRAELRARVIEEPWAFGKWIENTMAAYRRAAYAAVAIGQLTAPERIAALVTGLHDRLTARGLASGASFAFPLRQSHIAEAIGLTAVHVNRVIGEMRKSHLLKIENGVLTILDLPRLRELADVG